MNNIDEYGQKKTDPNYVSKPLAPNKVTVQCTYTYFKLTFIIPKLGLLTTQKFELIHKHETKKAKRYQRRPQNDDAVHSLFQSELT